MAFMLEQRLTLHQLKRQHSAEPLSDISSARKSPHLKGPAESPTAGTPQSVNSLTANAGTPPPDDLTMSSDVPETIGSPYKKQRPSLAGLDESALSSLTPVLQEQPAVTGSVPEARFQATTGQQPASLQPAAPIISEEEEL